MEKAKVLVKCLVQVTHEIDLNRPAAMGGAQRGSFDILGDLAGYNGDGASIYMNPGFPNFVSEYGSNVSDRPGKYIPNFTDWVENDYLWRSGKALWCAFHHGSILGDMGHMGRIDYYRLPLNSWYWYRKNLLGIETPKSLTEGIPYGLKLTTDKTIIATDGTEDSHIIVSVVNYEGDLIANSIEVILEVVSGGGIFPTGRNFILSPPDSDKSFSIGTNRPVFSSSSHQEHPSRNITDENYSTYWQPTSENSGEWIMIDLEGTKSVCRAEIIFERNICEPYEISILDDGINFDIVIISKGESLISFLNIGLAGKSIRYLKIKSLSRPAGIRGINIFT